MAHLIGDCSLPLAVGFRVPGSGRLGRLNRYHGKLNLIAKFIACSVVILAASGSAVAAGLRAAAVKVDITPADNQLLLGYGPRMSTEIHDRLYHRIVVLQAGESRFALVASDLGALSPGFYDEFARQVEAETGISRERLWWTVTHTHSAPIVGPPAFAGALLARQFAMEWDADYARKVTDALMEGIKNAISRLGPASMGVGTGTAMANMNRRARDVDGKIYLGLNPYGPVDRQVGLIRLERRNGSLIALLVNYAMHGTFLSAVPQISGDAPGVVASYLEERMGGTVLYINGAVGNIAPLYCFKRGFREITQMNVLLGDRVLEANRSIRVDPDAEVYLEPSEVMVETPMKEGITWPEGLDSYRSQTAAGQDQVRIPVRVLKLRDDLVLWAAPLELFCEIAIRVRNESPFSNTFYFGYSNGWMGYLPTRQALDEGGYETRVTPYTGEAEKDFGDAVIQLLFGLQ